MKRLLPLLLLTFLFGCGGLFFSGAKTKVNSPYNDISERITEFLATNNVKFEVHDRTKRYVVFKLWLAWHTRCRIVYLKTSKIIKVYPLNNIGKLTKVDKILNQILKGLNKAIKNKNKIKLYY